MSITKIYHGDAWPGFCYILILVNEVEPPFFVLVLVVYVLKVVCRLKAS